MNLIKRMSVLCLLSLMTFTASADLCLNKIFAEEQPEISYQGIFDKLEAFEILDAPQDAAATVKRKDMIPIMISCMKADTFLTAQSDVTPFVDVSVTDENIAGYNFLYESGYIKGGDGRCFFPERDLSASEAAAFIVRMYGYNSLGSSDTKAAMQMGIFDGVGTDGNLTYTQLYKMIYNALDAAALKYDGSQIELDPGKSILNDKYDIYKAEGIVNSTPLTGLLSAEERCDDGIIEIGETAYGCGRKEYYSFIGENVEAYYKESDDGVDEILYAENKNTKFIGINSDDIEFDKSTNSVLYYYNESNVSKRADIEASAAVIYNEVSYSGYGSLRNILPKYGSVELIDNNRNGKYDIVKITAYENYVVGYTDKDNEAVIEKINGKKIGFDSEKDNVEIIDTQTNKYVGFSEIKSDDVLTIAQSKNTSGKKYSAIYIVRNIIEGTVSSIKKEDNTVYTIGDTDYITAPNFLDYISSGYEAEPQLNKAMSFYLDYNSRIAMVSYKKSSGDFKYGVVGKMFWNDDDETLNLWIFNENGEWVKAPVSEKINLDGKRMSVQNLSDREKIKSGAAPQEVVRYKFSGTSFTDIDTEKFNGANESAEADKGNLTLIASGDSFNQRFNMCSDNTDISKSWYVKQNSVIIFKVPEKENLNETERFKVEKKISTHFYSTDAGSDRTQVKEGYKVFVTNIDDINTAECILLKGCDSSSSIESSSPYYMVSEISEGINSDGVACSVLTVVRNGAEMRYYTSSNSFKKIEYDFDKGNSGYDKVYRTTDASLQDLGLEKGDVVQLSLDNNNDVDGVCIVYRINQDKATIYQKFSVWDANFHWEESASSGTLEAVDAVNKIIRFNCMYRMARKSTVVNGVAYPADSIYELPLTYQSLANSVKITVYDKVNDSVSGGSLSALLPGDKLIMNMYYADSVSDIIAIRE